MAETPPPSIDVIRSQTFSTWLERLRDTTWKMRIAARIDTIASDGYFGDTKYLRDSVWELRFKSGSGFRVYYLRHEQTVVFLLCGGDKSTQNADIAKAVLLAKAFKEQAKARKENDKKGQEK